MTAPPFVPLLLQPESGSPVRYPTSLVGQPLLVQPDGTVKPGGGGGPSGTNFSNVLFADAGTTEPVGTGSILTPFKLLGTALSSVVANGTVYATPLDYSGEGVVDAPVNVTLVGMSAPGISLMELGGIAATDGLTLQNASVVGAVSAGGALYALDCSLQANVTGSAFTSLTRCNATGGIVAGTTLTAVDSLLWGSIVVNGTTATFQNCSFAHTPSITFAGSTGTIVFDSASYFNFMAAGGTFSNGHLLCTDPNVPKVQLTAPEELPAGGAGAYFTLAADGSFSMVFDATGIASNILIKIGIDANEFDELLGTYTELRANYTYTMIAGVATLLESATTFAPRLIGGTNLALQLAVVGSTLISLQGYKEAAGLHGHKYSGKMYVELERGS